MRFWQRPKVVVFEYAGAAFLALAGEAREKLASQLHALTQERPSIAWLRNRDARWVRPELTLRVRHLAGARLLRHATVEIAGKSWPTLGGGGVPAVSKGLPRGSGRAAN